VLARVNTARIWFDNAKVPRVKQSKSCAFLELLFVRLLECAAARDGCSSRDAQCAGVAQSAAIVVILAFECADGGL